MSVDLIIRGIDEASGVISGVSGKVGGLEGVMNSAGGVAGGVFKVGMLGAAAGLTAVAAGLVASIGIAGSWADRLDSMQDVLGGNAKGNAALAVAIQNVGGNIDAVSSQFTFLARGLETAKGKLGPTGLELQKLGINVYDTNGNLKDTTGIAVEVADVFAKMPDGIEKSALMTRVMGRSGKDLSDVMNELANGGLARADEQAQKLGLSLSDKDVAASKAFDRSMAILQMTLQGFAVTIGNSLMPFLERATKMMQEFLANPVIQNGAKQLAIALGLIGDGHVWSGIIHIGEAFGFTEDQMRPLADLFTTVQGIIFGQIGPAFEYIGFTVRNLADVLTGNAFEDTLPNIAADLASLANLFGIDGIAVEAFVGSLLKLVTGGGIKDGGMMGSISASLAELPTFLQSAVDLFGPIIQGWADVVGPAITDFVSGLVAYLSANLPLWIQAFAQFELAAWAWIEQAVPPLLAQLNIYANNLFNWVAGQVPGWATALGALIGPATQWILDALPGLAANLGVFTGQLLAFVLQLAIDLAGALLPLAWQFVSWIATDVIPQLPGAFQLFADAIVLFLLGLVVALAPTLVALGQRFVDWVTEPGGPADKIGGALATFWTNVTNAIAGFLKDITTKATDIGKALIAGIIAGIEASIAAAIKRIQDAIDQLLAAAKAAAGISSPARLFMSVGEDIMAGIQVGMASGLTLPVNYIAGAMPQLAAAGAAAGRAGGDVPWAGIPATNNQAITINANIYNNMDVEDLAARVAMVSRNRGN